MTDLADFRADGHRHDCRADPVTMEPCSRSCHTFALAALEQAEQQIRRQDNLIVGLRAQIADRAVLTDRERDIIHDAGQLWNDICTAIPDGPTRDADLLELIGAIHLVQRYFMGQAAARAYPDQYRLLGLSLDT